MVRSSMSATAVCTRPRAMYLSCVMLIREWPRWSAPILAQARPGLAAAALAVARILDNPRAINQQPAAAKVLISMLEKLRSASPAGRRGLAVVREMTKKGGA